MPNGLLVVARRDNPGLASCRFEPLKLGITWQAVRDVAFAELQQIDRVGFLAAVTRLPDWPAVP
jgi:hypothetical protein